MQNSQSFFLTTTPGLEDLLADELRSLGNNDIKQTGGGVWLEGSLEDAYRACLWSRLASRVMLKLAEFPIDKPDDLYESAKAIDWFKHFSPEETLAVSCTGRSNHYSHSGFAALRVKDAIVDHFRDAGGERPSIDTDSADIRISLFLRRTTGTLYLDLSGGTLHMRGYRTEAGEAPLKEHLAAAILIRCGWPQMAAEGRPLVDPMCGSGTFLIEAALIAAKIAPGLFRPKFGFQAWRQHDAALWERLVDDAQALAENGREHLPEIIGYDVSGLMVSISKANIERAGLKGKIIVARQDISYLENVAKDGVSGEGGQGGLTGLVVTNPPYGERLGEIEELSPLYAKFGERLIAEFDGWRAAVLSGNPHLCTHIGLEADKKNNLKNGPIQCQLLQFPIKSEEAKLRAERPKSELSEQAQMLAGRLRKNLKKMRKWAKKNSISCYRLYDADIPEYAAAIDIYEGCVHIQEYQAPKEIELTKAAKRMREIKRVVTEVLELTEEQVFVKVRSRQKGKQQYDRKSDDHAVLWVHEGGLQFEVNLSDYLDTGLFLDHRPVRRMIKEEAKGLRFLNLFAYTGTASLYAAAGGASHTTSVDLSSTYLDWAARNFAKNGYRAVCIDERHGASKSSAHTAHHNILNPDSPNGGAGQNEAAHRMIQADVVEWVKQAKELDQQFDLIFCDPPTFSNSKRMDDVFDVQRDHIDLIHDSVRLLAPDGQLIFSNNFRKFKMDPDLMERLGGIEISDKTIDEDFARNPKIHRCWHFAKS